MFIRKELGNNDSQLRKTYPKGQVFSPVERKRTPGLNSSYLLALPWYNSSQILWEKNCILSIRMYPHHCSQLTLPTEPVLSVRKIKPTTRKVCICIIVFFVPCTWKLFSTCNVSPASFTELALKWSFLIFIQETYKVVRMYLQDVDVLKWYYPLKKYPYTLRQEFCFV